MMKRIKLIGSKISVGSVFFDMMIYSIVLFLVVITLYPLIYTFSASISDPVYLERGEVILFPKGFYLGSYKTILGDAELWTSYYNTIWYTVIGTLLNIIFTLLAAYPLSRRKFHARSFYMFIFVFTMFFSGGIIPLFIIVIKLGLYNTRWSMVIPGLIATWNLIICRTYFQSTISEDLLEAARIEGATEFRILKSIVVPLSQPIIATLMVFYGVAHWNSFFNALLFLRDAKLHPLQILLRKILFFAEGVVMMARGSTVISDDFQMMTIYLQIRYAVIFVSILPILMIYPLVQKYFVKGMMIGSLKG